MKLCIRSYVYSTSDSMFTLLRLSATATAATTAMCRSTSIATSEKVPVHERRHKRLRAHHALQKEAEHGARL